MAARDALAAQHKLDDPQRAKIRKIKRRLQ
jgi:hypothetical protein